MNMNMELIKKIKEAVVKTNKLAEQQQSAFNKANSVLELCGCCGANHGTHKVSMNVFMTNAEQFNELAQAFNSDIVVEKRKDEFFPIKMTTVINGITFEIIKREGE